MNQSLILVDENDIQQGNGKKLLIHQLGLLHRAFSIFIFNTKGELLMQQRATEKYHSGGLWSNTCCSHPQFGEDIIESMQKRLKEEMGMKCKTEFAFSFIYKVKFDNGLTEHEYDHVYLGVSNDLPLPDELEVKNWKYISLKTLQTDICARPEIYTEWLKICLPRLIDHLTGGTMNYLVKGEV
jgi:isopentenyl-diphosphate delta-isomerase